MRDTLHPNAYLRNIRNVHCGLVSRTKILILLEKQGSNASKLAEETTFSYGVVMHHLMLLLAEGIVERRGSRRYLWFATEFGQKRLS